MGKVCCLIFGCIEFRYLVDSKKRVNFGRTGLIIPNRSVVITTSPDLDYRNRSLCTTSLITARTVAAPADITCPLSAAGDGVQRPAPAGTHLEHLHRLLRLAGGSDGHVRTLAALPYPALPCPALNAAPCPVLPCLALPCPALPCPVLSCP